MTSIRVLVLIVIGLSTVTWGYGATVFRVAAQLEDGEQALGLGVLVANELILTSEDLVSPADQVLVQHDPSGARTVADVRAITSEVGLALLSVPGLAGDPVTISKEGPRPGRFVYLLSLEGTRREGAFLSAFKDEIDRNRYRFTARARADENGAPLMNNCDQLLAIGHPRSEEESDTNENAGGVSGTFPDLMAFLLENEVETQASATVCPSLQDQRSEAIETGARLEEEKAALAKEIEQLEASIAEGKQRSQQELDGLESKRSQLAKALEQKNSELAAKQAEAERMARMQSELEERVRQNERELREREKELSDAREREEAVKEQVSFLEGLLIMALLGVSISLGLIAVMAVRKRNVRPKKNSQIPENRDDGRGQLIPPDASSGSPAGDDAALSERIDSRTEGSAKQIGDPRTVIAGGFGPHPRVEQTSDPSEPLAGIEGNVAGTARTSGAPVVGWLVIVDGPGKGTELILGNGQNTVGRGSDARVRIDFGDAEISRAAHAIVTYDWRGNQFYLQRGTGTNLTYMEGNPILEPIVLAPGSEFTLGNTTLRFVPLCDGSFSWANDR